MRNKSLNNIARQLRRAQTPEEILLWYLLRNRRFTGYKFRRQFPIDHYVVDFCCLVKRLIIELDGGQHNEGEAISKDEERTAYLEQQGFRVFRIWNNALHENQEGVLQKILELLKN